MLKALFSPSIALMNRLNYPRRFAILGMIVLVAIGAAVYSLFVNLDHSIGVFQRELRGLELVKPLNQFVQALQRHRGVSAAVLGGAESLRPEMASIENTLINAFSVLEGKLPANIRSASNWAGIRANYEHLRKEGMGLNVEENFLTHTELVERLLSLGILLADEFELTLDNEVGTYYLLDTSVVRLPMALEHLGQIRAYGTGILSKKQISPAQRVMMATLVAQYKITMRQLNNGLAKAGQHNPRITSVLSQAVADITQSSEHIFARVEGDILAEKFVTPPKEFFDLTTEAINRSYRQMYDTLLPTSNTLLQERIAATEKTLYFIIGVSLLLFLIAAYLTMGIYYATIGSVLALARSARRFAQGDLDQRVVLDTRDEIKQVGDSFNEMAKAFSDLMAQQRENEKNLQIAYDAANALGSLREGQNELNALMRGEHGKQDLSELVLGYLVERFGAGVGAFYLYDEQADELCLSASYAFSGEQKPGDRILIGERLIGEAVRQQRRIGISQVPANYYMRIASALGDAAPSVITAIPLIHGKRVIGAMEIGTFGDLSAAALEFLDTVTESIAISFGATLARLRTSELLEETMQQTEELRVQTEELRVQQEELQQSNEELVERADMLERQREQIQSKNREIETASEVLQQKADDMERVSGYKSEFMANMSHELRTPLNSLLILSGLLEKNKEGNLTARQLEFAATIQSAGRDLLNLINDILDLSKVEAGQIQFETAMLQISDFTSVLEALFNPLAEQKGIEFRVHKDGQLPAEIMGDMQRIQQIVKNLLSNAFKFTEKGEVGLEIALAGARENPLAVPAVAFRVSDTGMGIPSDKHEMIFQAFKQLDGSVSRKFGGTGLGLSISLQLARKMGGDIRLSSELGKGSIFTLYLPLNLEASEQADQPAQSAPLAQRFAPVPVATANVPMFVRTANAPMPTPNVRMSAPAPNAPVVRSGMGATPPSRKGDEEPIPYRSLVPDDRERVKDGERSILVVEDDPYFAKILVDMVRDQGFLAISAGDGEAGIALAECYQPTAVILDVMLPRIDGWGVMRAIKENSHTRHIPVHFITCLEDRQKALAMGAIGFVTKPVSANQLDEVFQTIAGTLAKSVRRLLIVEDDQNEAKAMLALLEEDGVEISLAASGKEALALLSDQRFDCMVLDLGLSDMSGFELLEYIQKLEKVRRIPVIIHSGRELTHEDERRLRHYAESIIIKGAKSPERLLNEATLFLHMVESNLHPSKQRMIRTAINKDAALEGKKILLVDDDMRNIFSLTSVLAEKDMVIIEAENGKEALIKLEANPDIAIVLMDIMMPEMDGYTAMREIRKNSRWTSLPVIAMTAKALKGDYEKCMAAGASDYISKPIDVEKMFSLIRVWIYQRK